MTLAVVLEDRVQLQGLHAFLAVAEDLSFRRAAARMHLSQPALSAQVATLESHLGVHLFSRDRTGTSLTPEGRELLPLARAAVDAAAEVELAARRGAGFGRRFTVGVLVDGLGALTWPVLRAFIDARPDVDLRIVRVGFDDAVPSLSAGAVDALFATGPFGEEDGVAVTVGTVDVTAIMPRHHPRAEDPTAETQWLVNHVTVAPPPALGTTWSAFWSLQDLGAPPLDRLRVLPSGSSLDAMMRVVSRGVIGAFPDQLPAPPTTVVRELDVPRLAPRQILVARPLSPQVRLLLDVAAGVSRAWDKSLKDPWPG
jgi:DNA-binding transcriptional LysR family regulator